MKAIKSILFFLTGMVLTILLFEFFLSAGGILVPVVHIDKNNGERYYPNKMCCSLFVGEGFGLARTNASGWFGKDFTDHGPSDISIAVLGNSFVACRQVFYRDNYLTLGEQSLNKKLSNATSSFYNFGKEAMPLTELLYIKEQITAAHHPDYFIVLINRHSFETAARQVPYYELSGDSLHLNLSFRESSVVKLYSKLSFFSQSSVFFLAYRVKHKLPELWEILLDKFYFPDTKTASSGGGEEKYSIAPVNKAVIERLAEDKKVVFLLDLDTAATRAVKALMPLSHVIDLQPPLMKMKKEQGIDPYYWKISDVEGHWNIPAHKVIGEEVAKSMADIITSSHK